MSNLGLLTVALASLLQVSNPPAGAGHDRIGTQPALVLPVGCSIGVDCWVQNYVDRDPSSAARDYNCGTLTYDGHKGTDFRVADMAVENRGVDVLAAADGRVLRVRDGVADVSIRAANAPSIRGIECGNGVVIDHGGGWNSQYCHMQRGTIVVKSGDQVRAGTVLGRMGLSGATEFPHLHFGITHNGVVLDPFSLKEGCGEGHALWRTPIPYAERSAINAGFAPRAVGVAELEAGGVSIAKADSPYLVAYVRAIGLRAGDRISLLLQDPRGVLLAASKEVELSKSEAEYFLYVGKRRPGTQWPSGTYAATYSVRNGDRVMLRKVFQTKF